MSAEPRPCRVLIVDDDFAVRLRAGEALSSAGFEIRSAGNAEEAQAIFELAPPDVVLLDAHLPGVDGPELCRRIRARPRGAGTPLLVMTARDDVDAVERAFGAGATDFVTRPLDLALLAHRVRVAADARRLAHGQRLARLASWRLAGGRLDWPREALEALWPEAPSGLAVDDLLALTHPGDRPRLAEALASGEPHQLEYCLVLPDGSERLVHQQAELLGDGALIGVTQDVTELRRAEEEITQLAFFDDLTGLANRAFVHRFLRRAVVEARKGRHQVAVLAVDLDRFRHVNDSFGAQVGDAVLREAAARIAGCVGGDAAPATPEGHAGTAVAARRSGDVFVVVLARLTGPDEADRAAATIHAALAEPFVLGGSEVRLTASIGVATFPDIAEDPRSLLERADAALRHVKAGGRNRVERFGATVQQQLLDRAEVERRLRRAVARLPLSGGAGETAELGEFELYYQPKVATDTGLLTGVEALLRWHPIDRMPIAPDVFIPIAEETGLIVPLGKWVLREACLRAQRWRDEGTPLRVSVNVSARQFREASFPQLVADVLRDTGFEAKMLELELTEQLMMSDNQHSARVLRELKQLGVHIALDDFAIGHSSLSSLSRLPLDTLKIDRSFVRALSGGERGSETIVAAIIALSKSLGLRVVAEGVETIAELELLTRHGAYEVQGYYFARPMPPDALMREMLDQGRVLPPASFRARAVSR